MSTRIILSGPSNIVFQDNGSFELSGGATASGITRFQDTAHPVHFIISHGAWQDRFSRPGAKALYETATGTASTRDQGETVVTFDGSAKTVTLGIATLAVGWEGISATISVSCEADIDIKAVLQPNACTKPPCPKQTLVSNIALSPL